jgi:NADH-quinone oxidoreductase subunit L
VIHALDGEQDIRKMGGLGRWLPVTRATFLVATLAIAGLPPFSGFFSKEELLGYVLAYDARLWLVGLLGSALTAFYMLRLYFLVFHGSFRGTLPSGHAPHEAHPSMALPLVVLALLSFASGLLGIPHVISGWLGHPPHLIGEFLASVLPSAPPRAGAVSAETALACALLAAGLGAGFALFRYQARGHVPTSPRSALGRFVREEYRLDQGYALLAVGPVKRLGQVLAERVEPHVGGGAITTSTRVALGLGAVLRRAQTGDVSFYALLMAAAAAALLLVDF